MKQSLSNRNKQRNSPGKAPWASSHQASTSSHEPSSNQPLLNENSFHFLSEMDDQILPVWAPDEAGVLIEEPIKQQPGSQNSADPKIAPRQLYAETSSEHMEIEEKADLLADEESFAVYYGTGQNRLQEILESTTDDVLPSLVNRFVAEALPLEREAPPEDSFENLVSAIQAVQQALSENSTKYLKAPIQVLLKALERKEREIRYLKTIWAINERDYKILCDQLPPSTQGSLKDDGNSYLAAEEYSESQEEEQSDVSDLVERFLKSDRVPIKEPPIQACDDATYIEGLIELWNDSEARLRETRSSLTRVIRDKINYKRQAEQFQWEIKALNEMVVSLKSEKEAELPVKPFREEPPEQPVQPNDELSDQRKSRKPPNCIEPYGYKKFYLDVRRLNLNQLSDHKHMVKQIYKQLRSWKISRYIEEFSLIGTGILELYCKAVHFDLVKEFIWVLFKQQPIKEGSLQVTVLPSDSVLKQKIIDRLAWIVVRSNHLQQVILSGFDRIKQAVLERASLFMASVNIASN